MPSSAGPAKITGEERTHEIAAILARGLARLRRPAATPTSEPISATQNVSKNAPNQLASVPEQSVTVHAG